MSAHPELLNPHVAASFLAIITSTMLITQAKLRHLIAWASQRTQRVQLPVSPEHVAGSSCLHREQDGVAGQGHPAPGPWERGTS